MADIADVLNALVTLGTGSLYPGGNAVVGGVNQPSVAGPVVKIMRGSPTSAQLDADMTAGSPYIANVTVNERPGSFNKLTTRFFQDWQTQTIAPASMGIYVSGYTVTPSGTPAAGQVAVVNVNGQPFTYAVQTGDTLLTVSTALTNAIAQVYPAVSMVNGVITLTGAYLTGSVSSGGTAIRPTRQQTVGILVSIFAPNFLARDAVSSTLDNFLSSIIRIPLVDGSVAMLQYRGTSYEDLPQRALTFRRNLYYEVEFSTTQIGSQQTIGSLQTRIGNNFSIELGAVSASPNSYPQVLQIGAIRFDGWYTSTSAGDVQTNANATALSPSEYNFRLPWFAQVSNGAASWGAATQATLDYEISVAALAGLNYWAFDSYQPTDSETTALTLYLSSASRSQIGFCMLGQFSNWSLSGGAPYSAAAQRDITMFAQPGYVRVLNARPLYYVLGSGTAQQMTAAVAWIRAQSLAQGTGDPYIVALSGAALLAYNNVAEFALAAGFDAAGAYECPPAILPQQQIYSTLAIDTQGDWTQRAGAGMPMVPTAMLDFDPSPLVANPPPGYSIPSGWNVGDFFAEGTDGEISNHINALMTFVNQNPLACPAKTGLIYAWNELGEGGRGLMPSYIPGSATGNISRAITLGALLKQ